MPPHKWNAGQHAGEQVAQPEHEEHAEDGGGHQQHGGPVLPGKAQRLAQGQPFVARNAQTHNAMNALPEEGPHSKEPQAANKAFPECVAAACGIGEVHAEDHAHDVVNLGTDVRNALKEVGKCCKEGAAQVGLTEYLTEQEAARPPHQVAKG